MACLPVVAAEATGIALVGQVRARSRLCYEKRMTVLKWVLIVAVLGYGGLLALMTVFQRALMYFPDPKRTAPAQAGPAAGRGSSAHQFRW